MKQTDSITIYQMILIIMTAIGLHNHVIVITPLIQAAGRDAWLSVLATMFSALIWALLLFYIHRGTNQEHISMWLKKRIGKPVTVMIGGLVYLYFLLLGTITLKETMTWTKITYLQNTPVLVLTLILVSLCIAAAFLGLRTIAIANFFILGLVILLGFFVAFTNIQYKDYSLLTPFLENGFRPVIKGMVFPASGFAELILVVFLQHKFDAKVKYRHIAVTILLLGFLTIGPLIGGIIEFGPEEAGNQRFTAFEEWGLVSLGKNIAHLDFFSIYQWLAGAFIRISMMFFVAIEIFKFKKTASKIVVITILAAFSVFFTVYPISDLIYYRVLKNILMPLSLLFCFSMSFILAGIVFIFNIKEKRGKSA
ncbi:spore germination protein GerXB [Bacillus freudenreichii]|nr:spore germination protein GerXB [Bacillus freudenreichii]